MRARVCSLMRVRAEHACAIVFECMSLEDENSRNLFERSVLGAVTLCAHLAANYDAAGILEGIIVSSMSVCVCVCVCLLRVSSFTCHMSLYASARVCWTRSRRVRLRFLTLTTRRFAHSVCVLSCTSSPWCSLCSPPRLPWPLAADTSACSPTPHGHTCV